MLPWARLRSKQAHPRSGLEAIGSSRGWVRLCELRGNDGIATVQPAGHLARRSVQGLEQWALLAAALHRPPAARVEGAARGQVSQVRRRAWNALHRNAGPVQ